jgi:hypothetical protein
MKLKGGRGQRESAAAWRLRQQLTALAAACSEAPGEEFPALSVVRELRPVFGSLCGGLDSPAGSSSSSSSGGGCRLDTEQCTQLLQEAADNISSAVRRLGGGQFAVSLLHAHLFLAWDALQCSHDGGSSRDGAGCSTGAWDEGRLAEEEAGAEAEACAAWTSYDFLGPAAQWRLSSTQYGGLIHMLGWEALFLDALLWLPQGSGTPRPAQLLALLAAAAPAAAVSAMQLLATARPVGVGDATAPCPWWRVLLHGLLNRLPHGPVLDCASQPFECFGLVSQLADAAAWGLADEPRASGDAADAGTAAGALVLLEQLLGDWQDDLSAAARADDAYAAALTALAARLEALQPQLQARVAAMAQASSGSNGSCPAAAALAAPTLIRANTRVMLCLLAWRQHPLAAAAAAGSCTATRAGGDSSSRYASSRSASARKALLQQLAQPEVVWPGSRAPWADLLQSQGTDAASDAPQGSSNADGRHSCLEDSGSKGATGSALVSSIIAQCRSTAAVAAEARPSPPSAQLQGTWGAPLLQLPIAAHAGDPDSAAQHCLALACAWLTPGVPCWWPLPCAPELQAAAGANPFAPSQLLAALLDMLSHVSACGAADAEGVAAAPRFDPATQQLLVALAVGIGSRVESPEQQRALLAAALPTPGSGAACDAAQRLALACERLVASDTEIEQSAAAGLVAISNRLIVRDAAQEGVVPSREQQACSAAEAARALLPHTLLWPGAVLRRLLLDGVKHRWGEYCMPEASSMQG